MGTCRAMPFSWPRYLRRTAATLPLATSNPHLAALKARSLLHFTSSFARAAPAFCPLKGSPLRSKSSQGLCTPCARGTRLSER